MSRNIKFQVTFKSTGGPQRTLNEILQGEQVAYKNKSMIENVFLFLEVEYDCAVPIDCQDDERFWCPINHEKERVS